MPSAACPGTSAFATLYPGIDLNCSSFWVSCHLRTLRRVSHLLRREWCGGESQVPRSSPGRAPNFHIPSLGLLLIFEGRVGQDVLKVCEPHGRPGFKFVESEIGKFPLGALSPGPFLSERLQQLPGGSVSVEVPGSPDKLCLSAGLMQPSLNHKSFIVNMAIIMTQI